MGRSSTKVCRYGGKREVTNTNQEVRAGWSREWNVAETMTTMTLSSRTIGTIKQSDEAQKIKVRRAHLYPRQENTTPKQSGDVDRPELVTSMAHESTLEGMVNRWVLRVGKERRSSYGACTSQRRRNRREGSDYMKESRLI